MSRHICYPCYGTAHLVVARRLPHTGKDIHTRSAHTKTSPSPTNMQAKGIEAHVGLLADKDGKNTFIPAFDSKGKPWSMQYIWEDGTKRFTKDSRKDGCFHPVGGMDAVAAAPALIIAEGYATAASLAEGLGYGTVAAFDCGNLERVARELHARFPDKPVIIAGDDDKHQEVARGVNPGRSKALAAAEEVGGKAIFPIFAPGEQQANPKQFTDFNDLAVRSALGREGLKRQVESAVRQALNERKQRKQTKEQAQERQQERRRHRRVG